MNNCTFTGRFTAAPRRKDTDKTSRCFFTLMVNKNGKRPDGTRYPAQAVDCVAWGNLAEHICKYKDKGHLVWVNTEFSTYETEAIDMNNQTIANARKVNRPIFTVREIEFMPVNNGQNNFSNKNSNEGFSNVNPADIPSYNQADFQVDPPSGDSGMSFDLGDMDDPFALNEL